MKQYFSYFKILFIILGVLLVVTIGVTIANSASENYIRKNDQAPEQRVYDNAGVLTNSEEESLEELIAKRESRIGCDIVLVTIDESVLEAYGRTENTDSNWEYCMQNYADDFYDLNEFGFNRVNGDGVLLLDNWYEGEEGSWLSTCGRVYDHYTYSMIDEVLDDVYYTVEENPYKAYKSYIENVYREMSGKAMGVEANPLVLLIIAVVVAGIFVATHIKPKEGIKTTVATTYVENGSVKYNVKHDELVNKYVTSRVIPQSSGGGGGSSGRAGGHTSRSGVRHGGGGRRR